MRPESRRATTRELTPRGWRRDAPTDLAYETGYADARRDVLAVVHEMSERVAAQVALAWLDGMQDGGYELPVDEVDDDVAEHVSLVRSRAGDAFLVTFNAELQERDWKRETEQVQRRPKVEDLLR